MNRPHFRRRPRPTDPEPFTRLDRLDGLDTRLTNIQVLGRDRYAQCDETCTADCGACKGRRFGPYAIDLDGLPGRTRYDAEWPSVVAAEAPGGLPVPGFADPDGRPLVVWTPISEAVWPLGGDLAAMAAPADWPAFTGWGEYDIGPWPGHLAVYPGVVSVEVDLPMVRAAATAYDLGLPVPLRSDPPLYRQALAGHVQVTR